MEIVEIPLEEILQDFFFRFTSISDSSRLERSIRLSGIRTPLQVLRRPEGYQIVSGFSRLDVAVTLKLRRIPALISPDDAPVERTFREVLSEHLICHSLNLVEKARVFRILEALRVPWKSMEKNFLPLVELPERSELVEAVRAVLSFSPTAQAYVETYGLSLKQARLFQGLSVEEQERLAGLGMELQIRSVELSEMISMFRNISGREGVSIEHLFERLDVSSILGSEELSRKEKISRIKDVLSARACPRLTSWNERLERLKREMRLPGMIQLAWDRSLEIPGVELRAQIRSVEDVDEIVALLSNSENHSRFVDILEMV